MSLFQKSVAKKYLNELDSVLIDQKYKAFQDYFGNPSIQENIRNSKEEQFQEGFLRELFVSIFGYTLNPQPNFNLTTELKNIDNSKKADGAILKGENAIAVIELKGTDTTDLDKIETQAFGYKNHHPKCVYVITSNFERLRFYIQNAVDHIDFDLFNLTRAQFSLMWLCLAKDNLLNGLPQKTKESSLLQEENITKKLYADYSKFREAIYNNLVKNNLENNNRLQPIIDKKGNPVVLDKLILFKKTQKLLDRFLFIFFAEDRLLLPPNSISEIVKQWTILKDELDEYVPLYDRFKKYFGYMNTGYKGKKYDIYAYNGGLFAPDEILDNITIDDDILHEHTLRLSNYDFETDVDVNILGHIFEHSLGEIENVQAEIASVEAVNNGINDGLQPIVNPIVKPKSSTQSKRKKDGIFYTPKYITKYIVENTVGKLCEEKRKELNIIDEEYAKGRKNRKKETIKTLDKKLTDYRNWLLSLTILDPACGSGAFLNQALDFLITEHRKIDELRAQLFGGGIVFSDITTDILEKNIYGVDINEESVEIAKLSLWLRTAQKGRKLNTLSNNIKCGNSLIDDPEVAGEKAFNWQKEFPTVFQKKEKKAWHVTWVTHDTRTSERMIKYKVRERRANGEMHVDRSIYLDEKDALKVTEIISDIIIEEQYNCLAYNICNDHIHILLVCEKEELTNIVRKLKGKSAQKFKEYLGISKDETFNLWAQKFDRKMIVSEEQFVNTIKYIETNRTKHNLPDMNEGLQPLVQKMTCTREHAFSTEYKGGFDVVIGNPPYVQISEYQKFYDKNYKTSKSGDLYALFYEKGIKLLKKNGAFSFITPSLFIKGVRYESLRVFLLNNINIIEIIDKGDGVFQNVQMPTAIVVATKGKVAGQVWDKFISGGDLITKITNNSLPLSNLSQIKRGLEIGKDKVLNYDSSKVKIITGEDVKRYQIKQYKSIEKEVYIEYKKEEKYFNGERIIIRETGNRITSLYVNENVQQNRSLYSILLVNDSIYYKYILVIINSTLMQFYYKSKFAANTNIFPKIRISQVKELPIKKISKEAQQPFIAKADLMLSLNKALQTEKSNFINSLKEEFGTKDRYPLFKITKKLDAFYELEYDAFKKELLKQKVKISLGNENNEWREYFNTTKLKVNEIQKQINQTDNEIDQMVYKLYGLTEEEIKIVEGSV